MNTDASSTAPGTVYLVGAGPGDPGLLTIAGRDALVRADVVIYDRLAHPSLLDYAPATAEKLFVGKASAHHFVRQEDTNDLMVVRAREGKTIVRLKGGDPFVFGRGGEECEYLRERGIPFRVVPGITSAIAAPAYAGIPVTHRDAASSFAVITGHERDDSRESGTREAGEAEQRRRWEHIANAGDTLVFLMGVESLGENARRLIENGRDKETPVALVQWGTWMRQRVVTGTLRDIADIVRAAGITAPAVTIVGEVVRYREQIQWFDNGPLWGKRIVVTRAREQASALSERLRLLGAEPLEFPTIRIAPPSDNYAALDTVLGSPGYDWVVFTSANGVKHTFDRLAHRGGDARAFGTAKIAAIGPATSELLRERGIRADFTPTEFVAEAVLAQFPEPVSGKRILLLRAEEAREVLPETWREQGAAVDIVPAYRTELATDGADEMKERLQEGGVDVVTFTSASTVRNFAEAIGGAGAVPTSVKLVAIGPITADMCRELLREPDATADTYTLDGMIETLLRL